MAFIQFAVSLIVLGILYSRMVRREVPDAVTKAQAVVPVILGVISTIVSFVLLFFIGFALKTSGFSSSQYPDYLRSVISAFLIAGLPEEVSKLGMILLSLLIFRSRIRNVYEYILIGAAVGFGFTLLEEFAYGSGSGILIISRLLTIASHVAFGIVMAKHLGKARYNRITGSGSAAGEYILAIVLPILIHTLFDAGTATNVFLESSDEDIVDIGVVIALVSTLALLIWQIAVLVRLKKNVKKYCAMEFRSAAVASE